MVKCNEPIFFYIFTVGYEYVVGAIQAEKELECSNKTFTIVVHNNTLVSFSNPTKSYPACVLKLFTLTWELQRKGANIVQVSSLLHYLRQH